MSIERQLPSQRGIEGVSGRIPGDEFIDEYVAKVIDRALEDYFPDDALDRIHGDVIIEALRRTQERASNPEEGNVTCAGLQLAWNENSGAHCVVAEDRHDRTPREPVFDPAKVATADDQLRRTLGDNLVRLRNLMIVWFAGGLFVGVAAFSLVLGLATLKGRSSIAIGGVVLLIVLAYICIGVKAYKSFQSHLKVELAHWLAQSIHEKDGQMYCESRTLREVGVSVGRHRRKRAVLGIIDG